MIVSEKAYNFLNLNGRRSATLADSAPVLEDEQKKTKASVPSISVESTSASSGLARNLWLLQTQEAEQQAPHSIIDEFMQWARRTPAEQARAAYLEEHGLTEADLAAMDPAAREAVEDEIAAEIERKLAMPETVEAQSEGDPSTQPMVPEDVLAARFI